MATINILDQGTINQIAAGEVVDRPSSIVKELVENAMDAGADAITVEIKDGGISLIRVTDNGCGIEKAEVRKAFLRHATSKISSAEDLNSLHSLGFRGEALSSIAAVSQVELITKTAEEMIGTRVTMEGPNETDFEEVGAPTGTTILVRNVFFNVPARKKFLKSPQTEGSYIAELMERLALSHPNISFQFFQNHQLKFSTSGNGRLKEVIYRIYGKETVDDLIEISQEGSGISMRGYVSKPSGNRSNRSFEQYFINGRFIKSKVISSGIEDGYHLYLMQHKYPFVILMIDVDPDKVDVNVHPSKMEVRFSDQQMVHDFIESSIAACLHVHEMIPNIVLQAEGRSGIDFSDRPQPFQTHVREESSFYESGAKPAQEARTKATGMETLFSDDDEEEEGDVPSAGPEIARADDLTDMPLAVSVTDHHVADSDTDRSTGDTVTDRPAGDSEYMAPNQNPVPTEFRAFKDSIHTAAVYGGNQAKKQVLFKDPEGFEGKGKQVELFEPKILSEEGRRKFRILGQIFDTYWLILYENKLLMIDQHAAHEKVMFERIMKQFHSGDLMTQNLFPPLVVTLNGKEQEVLEKSREAFANIGFEIDDFGGNEVTVRTAPVDLFGMTNKELFLEVLDELEDSSVAKLSSIEARIATMSCKAAVKGNNKLSLAEIESLLDQLLELDNPYFCPHGRPTMISFTESEIAKRFKRIVD